MDHFKCLVSVCCISYNHKPYIDQCLHGILNQKMYEPYEILIRDDASTDGTTEIIRRYAAAYPDSIYPIIETENQYSKGRREILLSALVTKASGKYIAVCETDDYWTDPYKLRKQIEVLETHPECVCCTHAVEIVDEAGNSTFKRLPTVQMETGRIASEEYLRNSMRLNSHLFHTSCIVFRKSAVNDVIYNLPNFMVQSNAGDRALFWLLAAKGDFYYINKPMSCYRVMSKGSWSAQMTASAEARHENHKGMILMAEAFDEYTEGKYKKEIYDYLTFYKYYVAMYELDGKTMAQPRYRNYYNQLSIGQKFYYLICAFFPEFGRSYRKIKKNLCKKSK